MDYRRYARWAAAWIAVVAALWVIPARSAGSDSVFLYGATFFYERMPRDQWAEALRGYRSLGINTIDLYVMWNWHEPREGDFDFTGRTNPRRDLIGLLKLIHGDGFRIVLRPGPVIRNEWRNGGYPSWLLTRPQYRMPLRDVLEGRYPATATLQNTQSNAAAREWMNNPLHMHYATQWLQEVFRTVAPWRDDIVAVALDDDQGAYLDNDTWPGPDFHRYINFLASTAHESLGDQMPVFINTFQMKVTASAPVWTWGNWYQSDAYSIGEHDRAQIEFSTGLLQTQQPSRPIMISEFQAGWLQGADQAWPRPADPTNTTLALHTMLQMGAHGIVNFPVQDTLNPAGWEAPWTNAFYAWDAAYSIDLQPQPRYGPTAQFGDLMLRYGPDIVQTHPAVDAAVAYLTSAYDPSAATPDNVERIAQATIGAQRGCRIMRITCALVDLRYADANDLKQYQVLIVPPTGLSEKFVPQIEAELHDFQSGGGRVVSSARLAHIVSPAAGGIPNAVLLVDEHSRFAFLDVVNYGGSVEHTSPAKVHSGGFSADVPALSVPARDALLVPLDVTVHKGLMGDIGRFFGHAFPAGNAHGAATAPPAVAGSVPLRDESWVDAQLRTVTAGQAVAYSEDVYSDGYPAVVLENSTARLIISPCAGARALVFEDKSSGENLFTTVGGLRDAWTNALPPSSRDYIAPYTHPIAPGTFNRCYDVSSLRSGTDASATFSYRAPDAPPKGATFRRTITMNAQASAFTIDARADFSGSSSQHGTQITSVAIGPATTVEQTNAAYAFYEPRKHRVLIISWQPSQIASHAVDRHSGDALVTLVYSGTRAVVRYSFAPTAASK